MTASTQSEIFRFDEFELDLRLYELRKGGEPVQLEPQVFGVLAHLVQNHDRVVTKEELFENVWEDSFVGEAALSTRLMEARKAIGDTGAAQRHIKTLRSRGYRFVGQLQDNALQSTSTGINGAGSEALTPVQPEPTPPPPEVHAPIGRNRQLEALVGALRDVERVQRRTVFISGSAGIGKSTLIDSFYDVAKTRAAVLSGECTEHEGDKEPYMPVLSGLARAGRRDPDIEFANILRRFAPTWLLQIPSLMKEGELEDLRFRSLGSTSESMLRQLDEALAEIAERQPVVILVEDIHWADASTISALQWLSQRRDPARVMVVGTIRSPYPSDQAVSAESVVQSLSARGTASLISLDPLNEDCAIELINSHLGVDTPQTELAAALVRRSNGNPMFMRSILDDWVASGGIKTTANGVELNTPIEELESRIPSSLVTLIESTISVLGATRLTPLEVASIAGERFSAIELAAGTETDVAVVESICEELASGTGIIERADDDIGDVSQSASYQFIHSLHREVLYRKVTPTRKRELHQRIGEHLEEITESSRADVTLKLADHFSRANDPEKAVTYLHQVANRAIERNAFQEALDSITEALQFIERVPESGDKKRAELTLLSKLSSMVVATRGWSDPQVEQSLLQAEAIARELGDPNELALILYGLATMRELLGQYSESEDLLKAQLEIASSDLTLEARELLACSTFHQGKFEEALDHAAKGLETYEPLTHNSPLLARFGENLGVSTNTWAALSLWFVGRDDEAIRRLEVANSYARDQVYSMATAQIQRAYLHQFRRDARDCFEWATLAKETAIEHGFPFRLIQSEVFLAWAAIELDHADGSLARLEEAVAAFDKFGAALDAPYYSALVAEQRAAHAKHDEAIAEVEKALSNLGPAGSFFYEPELIRIKAAARAASGADSDEVISLLQSSVDTAKRYGALPLRLRSTIALLGVLVDPAAKKKAAAEILQILGEITSDKKTPDMIAAGKVLEKVNG